MTESPSPSALSASQGTVSTFKHETEGWINYDTSTLAIHLGEGGVKHLNPISLPERFIGTKQPNIATCSEPREGNFGCPKWTACPFKKYAGIGPANLIMQHHGTTSYSICYDFYEVIRGGRPTSQRHYSIEGWVPNLERTTIDVLGTEPVYNSLGQAIARKQNVWQMQIKNLLPPWWGLLKKQGLPLPEASKRFPELIPPDEPAEETSAPKPSSQEPSRSVSRAGRSKRTTRAKASSGTASRRRASGAASSPTPPQEG